MSYAPKKLKRSYDASLTKDISSGGVLLTTRQLLQKGTLVTLRARFPFEPLKNSWMDGEVIASDKESEHRYTTRVKFIDKGEIIYSELDKFIQSKIVQLEES